jgi:hypothetical protein
LPPDVRAQGAKLLIEEQGSGRAALGRVRDTGNLAYWYIYDPSGLIPATEAQGEDPARVFALGEGTFRRICQDVEKDWYYCKIS